VSTLLLEGRTAFVTGSSRGIGWAIAAAFAREGAVVAINSRRNDAVLARRLEELSAIRPAEHIALAGDVSEPSAVKDCYEEIRKRFGRLDVLVNNAGIMQDNLIGMILQTTIENTFATNVAGLVQNLQYAARLMMRRGGGAIVNLASIVGRYGNAGQVVYSASKAAVIGVTLSAAKELAPQHIRVNAIAPGLIDTDMIKGLPPDKLDALSRRIGMQRLGTPNDVADVAVFLASDLARYVTGQVLGVDGGMSL
jgi:3-oxoacyl-[acyl-carrier protein] reductase